MLLEESGCSTMDELMALSEETLMELNEDLNDSNNFPERDGVVLPEDLYAAWEDEALADIDIMVGTNSDETRYWIREMGYSAPVFSGQFIYERGMPFMYENNLDRMSSEERELAKAFLNAQSGKKIWRLTEFYNELLFRIPAVEQAVRHKGTSYNYYFTMSGANETLGACHAMELAYVFNNPQETIYTGGRYNEELAGTMQDMWVNFARCGDPSTDEYKWEPYTAEHRMTMVLGEETGMTEDLKKEERELIEPLLHHYFNGCYSQLKFMVPQLGRIAGHVIFVILLVGGIAAVIVKTAKKQKRQKKND